MTTSQPGVLPSSTAEYVLPAPPRPAGEVVVVAPQRDHARAWRRGSDVARVLGDRFVTLVESQQIFATELRQRLEELDHGISEMSRAQLKGALRDLLGVLDWSDVVQADLLQESRLAASGAEPIDVADLCQEVANAVQTADQPVFVRSDSNTVWWGSAEALAEVVRRALDLVAERTQGVGGRSIEVQEVAGATQVRFAGVGEPGDAVDGDSIVRFRRAVAQVQAVVRPDALGPGGAGFVIELPPPAAAGT